MLEWQHHRRRAHPELIKSLPTSLDYIKPTLYTLTTINDVENLLKLSLKPPDPAAINPFALAAARSSLVCTNLNCKRTGHLIDDCYWPGGGKEGKFPAYFGNRHTSTSTHTATMATIHRVLGFYPAARIRWSVVGDLARHARTFFSLYSSYSSYSSITLYLTTLHPSPHLLSPDRVFV
ncbi:hypothetical protein B0H13DRAFT_2321732 [Mycena leptocephala]|nr:hypothetical protein B0H13DRAFT_2321732 [Mycena leptocephala]